MKCYIMNKFRLDGMSKGLSILFWIVNIIFVQICVNMFAKIISAGKSNWFNEALKNQVTEDPFIIYRTELIMNMLILILCVIVMFSIVSIVLFRNVQLKNILSQIGIYRVVGYDRMRIIKICMLESSVDIIVALPISLIASMLVWNSFKHIEILSVIMQLIDNSIWLDILSYIICVVVMFGVTAIHTGMFVQAGMKKGIRYMLGKGVV